MRQFRIITVVDSLQLGDVLGDLQERDCEIIACNVVKPLSKKDKDKIAALMPEEVVARAERALGIGKPVANRRRSGDSPIAAVEAWLREKAEGFEFRISDIIEELVATGYNRWSVKHVALRFVTHSPRFKKVAIGLYRVHNINEPLMQQQRPRKKNTAGRPPTGTMSARQWILGFMDQFEPGTNVTRAAIITAGKKIGISYASVNTALQAAFVQGVLERPEFGVYRVKPVAKPEQPPEQVKSEDVFRHIKEDEE